jgi:hypothetical protein
MSIAVSLRNTFLGRPHDLPLAFAAATPALTRSINMARSISANAATIVNRSLPIGEVVSTDSRCDTKAMPSDWNSSKVFSKCLADRANRSNRQQITTSTFLRLASAINRSSCSRDVCAPEIPVSTYSVAFHPRCWQYSRKSRSCMSQF